jgi:hypothetical protein
MGIFKGVKLTDHMKKNKPTNLCRSKHQREAPKLREGTEQRERERGEREGERARKLQ